MPGGGSHANVNERLYDYLVAAGRRGVGAKAIAAKAAKAEAKRLSRNKKQRKKRHEKKRQSECRSHETRDEVKLCGQDLAEEREEAVDRIEQERLSALPKEETEKFDKVIRNFQTEWPTERRHGWGEEDLEWTQEGDAMEFTIDIGDPKMTSNEEVIEHCNLWSLMRADDERVPERDPWDLGLEWSRQTFKDGQMRKAGQR